MTHDMRRHVVPAKFRAVAANQIEAILLTSSLARDGDIWEAVGCDLTNYRRNPIILWQHDPDHPVARADKVWIDGDKVRALITFPPDGTSRKSDEAKALVKEGVVSTMSAGAVPIEKEPLDPRLPYAGERWRKFELLEASLVSVPADVDAVITQRRAGGVIDSGASPIARDLVERAHARGYQLDLIHAESLVAEARYCGHRPAEYLDQVCLRGGLLTLDGADYFRRQAEVAAMRRDA